MSKCHGYYCKCRKNADKCKDCTKDCSCKNHVSNYEKPCVSKRVISTPLYGQPSLNKSCCKSYKPVSYYPRDCESDKVRGCQESVCGAWETVDSMPTARYNFAAASCPDQTAGAATQVDSNPKVYVYGGYEGANNTSPTNAFEKYDPNADPGNQWSTLTPGNLANAPDELGDISGVFVPDYTATGPENLGYIYIAGGNQDKIYQYNIKKNQWEPSSTLPVATINPTLAYLDDIGGPLAQLFTDVTGVDLPPCSDQQTLWLVGGTSDTNENQERECWYVNVGQDGIIKGEWVQGPNLPLLRKSPLIGRTFWRDAGITSFGVSNCASILVAGGEDENGCSTTDLQLLIRDECDWSWITVENNPTTIPDDTLTLLHPVSHGAFGTEPWPETLATGGRPILFGGNPENEEAHTANTQYAQFRFVRGRYGRDDCLIPDSDVSAWNDGGAMPGFRTDFKALPLSQENSSLFGGRRISRFLCVGGRTSSDNSGEPLALCQLYRLPTPWPFLIARENRDRCFNACI